MKDMKGRFHHSKGYAKNAFINPFTQKVSG